MPSIPLQRTLAISSLVYAATLWGLMWYPYRLLNEAGVGGIASSLITYAVPLLALGWLHVRELQRARSQWLWLTALGLAAGWTNLAYVLAVLQGEVVRVLLLFYLSPLWTVLFSRFLLHEKLNHAGVAVMALAAGGAMVMLWQPDGGLPLPTSRAEWLALSAGMMFAMSNVISRHLGGVVARFLLDAQAGRYGPQLLQQAVAEAHGRQHLNRFHTRSPSAQRSSLPGGRPGEAQPIIP